MCVKKMCLTNRKPHRMTLLQTISQSCCYKRIDVKGKLPSTKRSKTAFWLRANSYYPIWFALQQKNIEVGKTKLTQKFERRTVPINLFTSKQPYFCYN